MALALPSGSAALAVPIAAKSPRKEKKRKRPKKDKKDDKERDLDSDAELEISAEDLVAAGEGGEAARKEDGEGEDEEDEDIAGQVAVDVKQAAKRRRDETLLLRGVLDEEQGRRFDAFRGTVIPRAAVNKLNRDMYDQHVPKNIQPVLAGLLKIFVADVVETAPVPPPDGASAVAGTGSAERTDRYWGTELVNRPSGAQAAVPALTAA